VEQSVLPQLAPQVAENVDSREDPLLLEVVRAAVKLLPVELFVLRQHAHQIVASADTQVDLPL
jgi:hypothetical protein